MRATCLISGGKDSWYACLLAKHLGFEISSIINFISASDASYMLHVINARWVDVQARAARINCHVFYVSGAKEEEVEEMKRYLKSVVEKENIEMVISGAVRSDYQKHRIDMICEELGVISYAPLWHKDEVLLLNEIVSAGIRFVVVRTAAEGLEGWIGKEVSGTNVEEFILDLEKSKANLVGEGGEYETFVVSSPIFEHNLRIRKCKIVDDEGAKNLMIETLEVER